LVTHTCSPTRLKSTGRYCLCAVMQSGSGNFFNTSQVSDTEVFSSSTDGFSTHAEAQQERDATELDLLQRTDLLQRKPVLSKGLSAGPLLAPLPLESILLPAEAEVSVCSVVAFLENSMSLHCRVPFIVSRCSRPIAVFTSLTASSLVPLFSFPQRRNKRSRRSRSFVMPWISRLSLTPKSSRKVMALDGDVEMGSGVVYGRSFSKK
jgi:hypothetical protein